MSDELTTTDIELPAHLKDVAEAAAEKSRQEGVADSTRSLYQRRWARFEAWCASLGAGALGAAPETVVTFLESIRQEDALAASTLDTYAAAIGWAHEQERRENPTQTRIVRGYLSQIRREDAGRSKEQARPLYVEDLRRLLDTCDTDTLVGTRDRALLLVGYVGALRRSELSRIDVRHLEERPGGYLLQVSTQNNDPEGDGQWKAIPETGRSTSPAEALSDWLEHVPKDDTSSPEGAVFRSVDRWGNLGSRMTGSGIAHVFKKRVRDTGLDEDRYSTHSLRAGFVTQASEAGATAPNIQRQTGHKSYDSMATYIREGEALENPAVEALGL